MLNSVNLFRLTVEIEKEGNSLTSIAGWEKLNTYSTFFFLHTSVNIDSNTTLQCIYSVDVSIGMY